MKGMFSMNDFDNMNNGSTPNGDTPNGGGTGYTPENNGADSHGYSFNADGTYRYSNPVNGAGAQNGEPAGQYGYSNQNGANAQGYQQYNGAKQQPYSSAYPYQNHRGGTAYPENGGAEKKKSKGGKIFAVIAGSLAVILIVVLSAVLISGSWKTPETKDNDNDDSGKVNVEEIVTGETPTISETNTANGTLSRNEIYNKMIDSSVGLLIYNSQNSLESEGSGVIFAEDNSGEYTYIVTCAHVIADTSGGIIAHLNSGDEYAAEVVGYDTRTDIGVIKIKASGLKSAEIGDSSAISVGDSVYAIGNPGGIAFANSFTNGMVSALDRPVNSSETGYEMECIQHTAAINPGNSGGALVNAYGQVVGINSMKIVADEYEGMGFAVPSSVFVKVVNEIMVNGYVTNRPKLGITYVPASSYESYAMFVAIKGLPSGSIVIYSMSDDSSFANTEAKEGDMIVAVNGKDLDDSADLPELIENSNIGDTITLSLVRINKDYSFKEFEVEVTLVEDKGDQTVTEEASSDSYENYDDLEKYFKEFFGRNFNP